MFSAFVSICPGGDSPAPGAKNRFVGDTHLSRELGIEVVGEPIGILPKQEDYGELAERVAASGADLVFYGGIIQNGAGPLWRDIRAAAPEAKLMGSDALFEEAFIADADRHAEGTLITFGGVPPALLEGPGRAFFGRYVERFGKEPES